MITRVVSPNEIPANVKQVYFDSFPEEERRLWESVEQLIETSPYYKFNLIIHNGYPAGLITTWDFPEAVYVEHFAIDSSKRDNGIGSKILSELAEMQNGKPVILEVEHAGATAEAERRIRFYHRNGFNVIKDYNYIQPPYSEELPPVPLLLMTTGKIENIDRFVKERMHKEVYGIK